MLQLNNHFDEMILPTAKLFYLISQMHKDQQISNSQRQALKNKGLVISEKDKIYQSLDEYEKHQNLSILKQMMINNIDEQGLQKKQDDRVRGENNYSGINVIGLDGQDKDKIIKYIQKNPDVPDEIASPLGTQLFMRKKKQNQNNISDLKNVLQLKKQ